ncbi:MAG: PAS domain-containing protein [Paludibacter sp.]|nr:PAS domain-containing protein [Paludibacter sp.]
MKTNILDILDFEKVDSLLEGFNKTTGFVTAILDLEGNILSKSGWRQMCTEFHRIHPETSKRCTISDTILANKMAEGEKYHFYQCLNGLVDVAVPITIRGEHIANLFSGQFFFEPPNLTFFKKQAKEFGFDEASYLESLSKVPVMPKEKVKVAMDFLLNMTQLISDLAFQKTEHMQAEEALYKSNLTLSYILDTVPQSIFWKDRDGVFLGCNKTFANDAGSSNPSDIIGKTDFDLSFPKEDAEAYRADDKEVIDLAKPKLHIVEPLQKADGTRLWIDTTKLPIYDKDGNITGILGVFEDITERKNALTKIQEQRHLLETVINHLPAAVCVLNGDDLRVELVNPQYQAIAPGKEMKGKTWDELWPETGQDFSAICREVLRTGEAYHVHDELNKIQRSPDGPLEDAYFSWSLHRIKLSSDDKWGLLGTSWETTERIKAAQELLEKEIRFRSTLSNMIEGCQIIGYDWRYIFINASAELHNRRPNEELMGKRYMDMWPGIEETQVFYLIKDCLQNRRAHHFENEFTFPDETTGWFDLSIQPVPEGVFILSVDITERKKAENIILKLNEELEEKVKERTAQFEASNKELEAFSYSVSHDLRAPLRHINGYVDLLTQRFNDQLPEKAQHYLTTITNASKQMGTLIDDLLQFSRTGRKEVHREKTNMNKLLKEVLEDLKPDIGNRKVDWDIQNLPEIYVDNALLKQVWMNLIDNALKYTRNKEIVKISIGHYEENKHLVFYVHDNGVGFNMQYAHKLFGVFQRLHAQTEFEGTGIGLANVQRIIHKHSGQVWAEAEPDKGATFYFSLPKNKED